MYLTLRYLTLGNSKCPKEASRITARRRGLEVVKSDNGMQPLPCTRFGNCCGADTQDDVRVQRPQFY